MAISPEFQAAMDRVDRETTETATKFRQMAEIISTSMSPQDVQLVQKFMNDIADRQDALGNNPEEPVPPEPAPEIPPELLRRRK